VILVSFVHSEVVNFIEVNCIGVHRFLLLGSEDGLAWKVYLCQNGVLPFDGEMAGNSGEGL
jgi:hypothetical protein